MIERLEAGKVEEQEAPQVVSQQPTSPQNQLPVKTISENEKDPKAETKKSQNKSQLVSNGVHKPSEQTAKNIKTQKPIVKDTSEESEEDLVGNEDEDEDEDEEFDIEEDEENENEDEDEDEDGDEDEDENEEEADEGLDEEEDQGFDVESEDEDEVEDEASEDDGKFEEEQDDEEFEDGIRDQDLIDLITEEAEFDMKDLNDIEGIDSDALEELKKKLPPYIFKTPKQKKKFFKQMNQKYFSSMEAEPKTKKIEKKGAVKFQLDKTQIRKFKKNQRVI